MSKSVRYLVFVACLAICTLSSGSAWRTLSGAWQGPWSLTGAAAVSVAAAAGETGSDVANAREWNSATPAGFGGEIVASLQNSTDSSKVEPRAASPVMLPAATAPTSAGALGQGAVLALSFE